MFERYSENARRTLFFARYEASGSPSIEVHHLLLGLIREGQEVTARIFAEAGVSLPDLRREIEELVPRRTSIPTSVEIPFSAYTKKALHAAAEEAERFLHNHIGPEHLLVGLLRIDDSPAAKLLTGKGVGPATVREAIAAMPSVAGLPGHKTPPLRTLKAAIAYAWDCDERYVDMSDDEARRGLLMTMAGTHADADKVELRDAIEKRFGLTVTREVRDAVSVHLPVARGARRPSPGQRDESTWGLRPRADELRADVEAFIDALRAKAGLIVTPATRDVTHLVVRRG